jgi:hypothetical protein
MEWPDPTRLMKSVQTILQIQLPHKLKSRRQH